MHYISTILFNNNFLNVGFALYVVDIEINCDEKNNDVGLSL